MNTIIYTEYASDGIFGTLYLNDSDKKFCVLLGHAYESNLRTYLPKVMPGVYKCVRGIHHLGPKALKIETFEITGIVGHSGLLFHPGNWNKDSEGCTLLGQYVVGSRYGRMVGNSQATFKLFMQHFANINEFQLEVQDGRTKIS